MTFAKISAAAFACVLLSGCAVQPEMPFPSEIDAPDPIEGNTGAYMSPYTSDEVVAEWVDNAIDAQMGSAVGGLAGAYAGQQALEQIPFVGGIVGAEFGKYVGREIALEACGGEEFVRQSSDLSFNSLDDLSVYLYVEHSDKANYQDVLQATMQIYPEMKTNHYYAISNAAREAR